MKRRNQNEVILEKMQRQLARIAKLESALRYIDGAVQHDGDPDYIRQLIADALSDTVKA